MLCITLHLNARSQGGRITSNHFYDMQMRKAVLVDTAVTKWTFEYMLIPLHDKRVTRPQSDGGSERGLSLREHLSDEKLRSGSASLDETDPHAPAVPVFPGSPELDNLSEMLAAVALIGRLELGTFPDAQAFEEELAGSFLRFARCSLVKRCSQNLMIKSSILPNIWLGSCDK